jgi:LPS sulfotransferase NodH
MSASPTKLKSVRYDLSRREADYPNWEAGKPLSAYVLCTHMRSGSTLLGEAMYYAGGMGCPLEYFHVGFQPTLSEMWGATDHPSYVKALYRHRTDPSGSLGVKLFWMDLVPLCLNHCPDEAEPLATNWERLPDLWPRVYAMVEKIFKDLFPQPRFIFLKRQDHLRQAISSMISGQVHIWRSIPGVDERCPSGVPTYDYDVILGKLSYAAQSESRWKEFFEGAGITPYVITYEDLATDYDETIRAFLMAIGKWKPKMVIRSPRLKRQASRLSEEFAWRFLEEHAKKGGS